MTGDADVPVENFSSVLADELSAVKAGRAKLEQPPDGAGRPSNPAASYEEAQRMRLKGLAFSGGGIRSATFNLGIIQALAEGKLLRRFDYLSTVSGGGYIGSWLSAQVRHGQPIASLEAELSPTAGGSPKAREYKPIGFLRQYSNYLTPRIGLLSLDTLSGVAGYLRNVILVQTMIVALLAAALLVPRSLFLSMTPLQSQAFAGHPGSLGLVLGCALLLVSLGAIGVNLQAPSVSRRATGSFVAWWIIAPAVVAAFGLAAELSDPRSFTRNVGEALPWVIFTGLAYGALTLVACVGMALLGPRPEARRGKGLFASLAVIAAAPLAGAVGGVLLYAVHAAIVAIQDPGDAADFALALVPFLLLLIFSLVVVFHLGLIGRIFDFQIHEWWARYGACLLAVTVGAGGLFVVSVYGPPLVDAGIHWAQAGGLAWLATTLWGVVRGASSSTGGDSKSWSDRLVRLVPYVFIAGLALALSWLIQLATGSVPGDASGRAACGLGGAIIIYALLAWRLDINLFSFHAFYRNRLTRCYLGGARAALEKDAARRPHPFTGFDPDDDVALKTLIDPATGRVQRPFHILNTTLNSSAGKDLAWQQRKAASFFFSPLYCGYRLPPSTVLENRGGFVATERYMRAGVMALGPSRDTGPMLGSVMAVSGAAASPNWGFHTSAPVAFLLTLFNVRLGRWCPNTGRTPVPRGQAPLGGGLLLLKELFGLTDSTSPWLYLSDGGHFDNLGIYELVRRRTSLILAMDCGQDVDTACDDLADTLRKCYTDFGVRIVLEVDALKKTARTDGRVACSEKHFVAGTIEYPALADAEGVAGAFSGTLILVKPTLTEAVVREAPDLRNYAIANPEFPQQTTADQWFDEAQFESYRKLGYMIGRELLGAYFKAGSGQSTLAEMLA